LTLSYLPGSGNRAGFRWQKQTGRLPVRQLVGGMLVDNSYEQHRASLLVDWTLSEQSRVDLSLGRASRSYPQSAARNYSDWEFSAGYEWRPRAGFSLTAVAQNGVSDTEEINIGLVVVKRLALTPTLRLGDGVTLSAYVELSDRKYLGDPGLEAIDGSAVTERFHVVGLTVAWTPIPRLRLGFAWRKQRRDSTLSFANYDADVVEFEARVSL
jgi:hypothetical protein